MSAFRTRPQPSDVPAIAALVKATGRFREGEIAVAVELVEECLEKGEAKSGYHFLFADGDPLAGYACYGPIEVTEGSFDLYWIVVHPGGQGQGLGRRLLAAVEAAVTARAGRLLYADTSSAPTYAATRAFYAACGYLEAAELPDYYAPGDGKVIFCKRLSAP